MTLVLQCKVSAVVRGQENTENFLACLCSFDQPLNARTVLPINTRKLVKADPLEASNR